MFLKLSLGAFFIIKKDCETDSVHLLSLLSDKRYKNHLITWTKVRMILRARRWGWGMGDGGWGGGAERKSNFYRGEY